MDTALYTVYVNNIPLINLGNDTTLCQGQILVLKATNFASTFLWQDSSTNATYNVTQQGIYWVKVTNYYQCSNYDTIHVSYSIPFTINLGNDSTLCQGEHLVLNATKPNATYIWQDSTTNPTYNVNHQGIYWVKVSNQYNCFSYDTINVNYNPLPQVNLGNDTTLCPGQSLFLNATKLNSTYLWQDNSQNPTYNVTQQGMYWVQVITNNCSNSDTINVYYSPLLNLFIGNDTTLCYGKLIKLDATNANSTYKWQDNSNNSTFIVNQKGTYWVTVTDNNNCLVSDTIKITYQDCFTPDIYIPNAFTPNGDGLNDVFKIETLAEFSEFHLYIYNRWGEQIFYSEDKNKGWDGTFKGKVVPNGVYVYQVTGIIKDTNKQIKRNGTITILR